MKKGTLSSQSGFSLVELMVVVAIIGVLAAMSAGQVQKQIAKARQSEAKTNLATLWSSMETFKAEWAAYTGDFGQLKLAYAGQLRYNTGFAGAGPAVPGYTGTAATGQTNAGAYCTAHATECSVINSNGTAPTAPSTTPAANTFVAQASAAIYNTTQDLWTIDQGKSLLNAGPGIP